MGFGVAGLAVKESRTASTNGSNIGKRCGTLAQRAGSHPTPLDYEGGEASEQRVPHLFLIPNSNFTQSMIHDPLALLTCF